MKTSGGARQWRAICPCREAFPGADRGMHSQVSQANLPYFISEGRVPAAVDEAQLRQWYDRAKANDRDLLSCNHCRRVKVVGGGMSKVLAGPEPRGSGSA